MWNLPGNNEIHNLKIKDITNCSWMDNPFVTLRCTGYVNPRIGSTREIDIRKYGCTVRVYGELMGYVLNELAVGDKICVIGYSDMALGDGKYKMRVTVATQIYKPDWFHYL